MRVGIDYRILSVGRDMMTRGMPRYTQQQLREVLALDADSEYVLLCNRGNDLALVAPDVLAAENVSVRSYAPPRRLRNRLVDATATLEVAEHYQDWIHQQDLSVYHATTPFLLEYPLLITFDACPMVATFYDAIPLLFPNHYFHDPVFRAHYERTVRLVGDASRLLAISDAAGRDAVEHLGIAPGRVDRAWPIPDAVFRPLPDHLLAKLLLGMEWRFRLPERYLLTVTYPHYAKNLETLLAGYAALPAALRAEMPLVLCCHLSDAGRQVVSNLVNQAGIGADVVLTGVVSDAELCALYNRATMVVHPSLYEGFGLPIAEAMACGAPVVTTTSSSMPEVAGNAAILVAPEEPGAFTEAIATLAMDPGLQEDLRRRGFQQVRRFNGEQLGRETLASYRRAAAGPAAGATAEPGRPRLAIWTPLPPQQTGIADYSAELLGALARRCDLEVFVDSDYLPDDALLTQHRIQHFRAFERRQSQAPFDAVLFQVGSSLFHHYMADALRTTPGIVVLHDLSWSPVLYTWWQNLGAPERFEAQVAEVCGHAALAQLRALAPGDPALWDFFARHPMLDLVLEASVAQIVHLEAAAQELAARYPSSHPWVVPMGVEDPCAGDVGRSPRLARGVLGMPAAGFVVGVFGIVHANKHLEACLRAFARVARTRPEATLLIVGRWLADSYRDELAQLAGSLGIAQQVRMTGHVDRRQFDTYLKAADVIVNLREPLSTHMSATLIRAIAAGRPVIINDLPEWQYFPESFCLRVPSGAGEEPALAAALERLAGDAALVAAMAGAARAFYEREGTIAHMASRYLEVVGRVCAAEPNPAGAPVGSAATGRA